MAIVSAFVAAFLLVFPIRIGLSIACNPALPPAAAEAALAEASAIWAPYGVDVVAVDARHPLADRTVVLRIVVRASPAPPGAWAAPLGAIEFDADGAPGHVVTVFVDRVVRLLDAARPGGHAMADWPRATRERVIGRAIGRIIAHEIGHFLLRTRTHASSGLMRAAHSGDDLLEPGRQRFRLRD